MGNGIKSAKLKLARAEKHVRAIKRCVAKYSGSTPHKIVSKSKYQKQLNIPKPPPLEISLLAGEAIYQMRSALDHLAFELIQQNPNIDTIDPGWRENTQFPLRTRIPKNSVPPLPKSRFAGDLPGIADKPFAFVESLQPYYGIGAINNALRFLVHLSNIDKHRHLNLIRPRTKAFESVRFVSGSTHTGYSMLDRGAKLESPAGWSKGDPPVYVNRRYRTVVSFNEKLLGGASGLHLDYLLELILEQIKMVIVPAFQKFVEGPHAFGSGRIGGV